MPLREVVSRWRGALGQGLLRRFSGVLMANAVNNLVSFAVVISAARVFGPELFGVLALAISITLLLSMLLDFGSSVALVRLYNIETSPNGRADLVRAVLMLKVVLLVLLVPLAFALQSATARLLPITQGHEGLIYLAFVSGALLSFWATMRAVEQASRNFASFERYTLAYAVLRAVCAAAVLLTGLSSITSVFVSLYTVPLVGLLVLWWFTGYRSFFRRSGGNTAENLKRLVFANLRKVFAYSVWVAVSALCYAALLRLPQFVLANAGDAEETGLYSAALTFVAVFSLMNDALRTVILPDVTALRTHADRGKFRRRFLRLAPVFLAVAALALGSMALAQYYILGGTYAASIPIFLVLGAAVVVTIYIGIFNTLVHSYGIPRLDATNNLLRLAVLGLLLWILPATAMTATLAFGVVLVLGELRVYAIIHGKMARSEETLT